MRSREKRVENTDHIKSANNRLNDQIQYVDEEWNRVMTERDNWRRAVESKIEERDSFLITMKRARICQ